MRKLHKSEYVKRWLRSGKGLTQRQAMIRFEAYRLAVIVERMKHNGEWIINIGPEGKYANYAWFQKGPITKYSSLKKFQMVTGFKLEILDAGYFDGFADMWIRIKANNGYMWEEFTVTSHEFRSIANMKAALKEQLKKVEA